MLFVFSVFTNNVMAWDGNGTAGNPWKIGDTKTNTATAVTAVLNGNTLTISGSGNMADFWSSAEGEAPWWFNTTERNAIQFVTIENGVTNVGQRAFKDCSNLQSITIPNSVLKINEQAFYNCTNLLAIANLATTPQIINNNTFQGINPATIYLATPEEATAKYKTTDTWKNFKFAEPYILFDENLGSDIDEIILGLDGTILYLKYQKNNPKLLERLIVSDVVSAEKSATFDYAADGSLRRAYIDNTVFSIEKTAEDRCNISSISSNGDYNFVENILWDIYSADVTLLKETAKKYALDKAKEAVTRIMDNSLGFHIDNTAPSWIGLTKTIVSVLGVDEFMSPSVKVVYTGFMGAFSGVSMITSCGSAILLATTPITLAAAFPSIALCAYNVHSWYKGTKAFADAIKALDGNNGNTGCPVTASLNGGTLEIIGSGALCSSEINKYSDRKSEIRTLIVRSGVTSIPSNAFSDCTSLTNVEFSNGSGTLSLGSSMFSGSNSIQTVNYGRNLHSGIAYGDAPFRNKTALKTITFGNNVTSVPNYSFNGCTGLTGVSGLNNITSIGFQAFQNCSSLAAINIPNTVTSIGGDAFINCGLTSITIPNSVTSIGSNAFSNCISLTNVEFSVGSETLSLGGNTFSGSNSIQTVNYGRNLRSGIAYGDAPFRNKTALKIVTFNNNITSIPANSFSGCTGLSQITSNAKTPPTLQSNTFNNVGKNIPVYINCNYLSTYQSTRYWSEFTNYQCAVQVVPASNSAVVTFPKIDNAANYTLNIYSDEDHTNSVAEVHLDDNGNPKSAPAQNSTKSEITLSYTVSGLSANTRYYYSLTPYNADGYMLTIFTGDFTTTADESSIVNIVVNQMSIYPNPAKHEIFIKSELQIEKVEIYSLTGSLMITENNYNEKISVSTLPQGIYLLNVYTDTGLVVSKIVKK